MLETIAGVHVAATLFMTGVIWFVQLVHYPLFRHVDRGDYPRFQRAHETRTTRIVAPAMTTELTAAIALAAFGWSRLSHPLLVSGLALLAVIWLSTGVFQVPRHRVLERGFDPEAHRFLTRSNWLRTAAWSVRSVIAFVLQIQAMSSPPA